ncbi:MAG: hypothetical protein ONB23_06905 [candidate division KSB1 bacterium]|nr:hypothetical protein [candidate division KSB1 bacterium]
MRRILALACGLVAAASLQAGVILVDFKAEPGLNKVTLVWRVRAEQGIEAYEVERSLDPHEGFQRIGRVEAEGTPSAETVRTYTYVDKTIFKASDRTYYYRLRIVESNGRFSYSDVLSVAVQVSAARHTWGSIKAMFR